MGSRRFIRSQEEASWVRIFLSRTLKEESLKWKTRKKNSPSPILYLPGMPECRSVHQRVLTQPWQVVWCLLLNQLTEATEGRRELNGFNIPARPSFICTTRQNAGGLGTPAVAERLTELVPGRTRDDLEKAFLIRVLHRAPPWDPSRRSPLQHRPSRTTWGRGECSWPPSVVQCRGTCQGWACLHPYLTPSSIQKQVAIELLSWCHQCSPCCWCKSSGVVLAGSPSMVGMTCFTENFHC